MTSQLSPLVIKIRNGKSIAEVEKGDKRMYTDEMFKYILQRVILDIFYFPVWWYTRGLLRMLRWAGGAVGNAERQLALGIWLKAMFKPMFQDYTWEGRLVSFFMRAVLLIFKMVMFGAWTIAAGLVIVVWIALPITALVLLLISFNFRIFNF